MKILALEFSSPRRSVAVLAGDKVLAEQAETAGEAVPPLELVERALSEAKVARRDIECVAVGLGPGSYTGIRGAIALAQGWQLAANVKLAGISSVDCLAREAQAQGIFGEIRVVLDAQRGELYVSGHEIGQKTIKSTYKLTIFTLTEVEKLAKEHFFIVGTEVNRWFPSGKVLFPSAAVLGRLAAERNEFVSGSQLEPIYLRETSFVKAPPVRMVSTL